MSLEFAVSELRGRDKGSQHSSACFVWAQSWVGQPGSLRCAASPEAPAQAGVSLSTALSPLRCLCCLANNSEYCLN